MGHKYTLDTFVCKIRADGWRLLLDLSPIRCPVNSIRRAQTIWYPAEDLQRALATRTSPTIKDLELLVSGPSVCDSSLRNSPEKRNRASLNIRPSRQPDCGRLYFFVFDFCKF